MKALLRPIWQFALAACFAFLACAVQAVESRLPVSLSVAPYAAPLVFKAGESSSSFAYFTVSYSDGSSAKVYANPYITGDMSQNLVRLVSSDPAVLTFNDNYWYVAGKPTKDTPVTLTATYAENGGSVTATFAATVKAADPFLLTGLKISCPTLLASGATGKCSATATYQDNSEKTVAPVWASSNLAVVTIGQTGELLAATLAGNASATISASYTEGGVSASASAPLSVAATTSGLSGLTVSCPAVIVSGASSQCSASARFSGAAPVDVSQSTAGKWSSSASALPITNYLCGYKCPAAGIISAGTVVADTRVTVTFSYTKDGVTQTAAAVVLVQPKSTGEYQAFLAALVPGVGWFYYDGKGWPAYRDAMSAFAGNVSAWSQEQAALAIVAPYAAQAPDGTAIYTGYGTSLAEMLASLRYRQLASRQCSGAGASLVCEFK